MGVLGSVKNRIKTMFFINRNKKKNKMLEEGSKPKKKIILLTKPQTVIDKKIEVIPIIDIKVKVGKKVNQENIIVNKEDIKINNHPINDSKVSPILTKQKSDTKNSNLNIKQINIKSKPNKKVNESLLKQNKKPVKDKVKDSKPLNNDKIKNRLSIFLKETKLEIKKIKQDLIKEEQRLKEVRDKESLEKEEQKIEEIHKKIVELKDILEKLTYEYDFKYYEELNDELLSKYIDDFKFKHNSLSIDSLVEECKIEVNKIEELTNLTLKLNDLDKKKEIKKEKINTLEKDYDSKYANLIKLDRSESVINRYLSKEEEYLKNLTKEIDDLSLDSKTSSYLKFDKNYINNLFRLGVGISAFKTTFVGAFIGAFLINSATSNLLKKAFTREYKTSYFYKYQEFTNKIKTNIDLIDETLYLIKDSIQDIIKLKIDMGNNYGEYLQNPKYKEMYQKIVSLEKMLIKKENDTLKVRQKVEENNEKNKVKLKKLEEYNS